MAAQAHDELRNPVILLPGILGTRLVDPSSGTVVWGAFGGDYANPHTQEGARLCSLPMKQGAALRELTDGVATDGVLDRVEVRFLGLPLELKAYVQILRTLGSGGYRDEELGIAGAIDYGDEHYTCFQFDYDWRRDNVENARRFHDFIEQKKAYIQAETKKRYGREWKDLKFDIIAHSMGGLVTRYYLRYGDTDLPGDGSLPEVTWTGARNIERVIFIGTPNAGSVDSVIQLVEGIRFSPIFHKYEAALLSTYPSIYQLFPRTRHGAVRRECDLLQNLDVYDARLWEENGWGLASPEQDWILEYLLPGVKDPGERREIALDHLRKCLARAKQLGAALDRKVDPPPGLSYYLMVGDAIPTNAVISVDDDGRVEVCQKGPGDGTVLRSSALMDERVGGKWQSMLISPLRWRQTHFLFSDHLGMTRDPGFTDNVLYILLEDPRD